MKKVLTGLFLIAIPAVSAAQDIGGIVGIFRNIADNIYQLIFVLIVLAFAWGVLKFVFQTGDAQEDGKKKMMWSIIALFILVSVWGIVALLQNTLSLDKTSTITAPAIPEVQAASGGGAKGLGTI